MRQRGPPQTAPGGVRDDPRERLARQIQKINEGFWGTLHANTMNKSHYNNLMTSKEAQSFGSIGPSQSLTKGGNMNFGLNNFNSSAQSSAAALGGQNIGTQANANSIKNLTMQERQALENQIKQ